MEGGIRGSASDRARAWLDDVAESWIGYALPPPRRWMALGDWAPDHRRDYCGRCGQTVGRGEATLEGCGGCRGSAGRHDAPIGDGLVRLGAYEGALREAIQRVKYERWFEMATHLGVHMAEALQQAALVERDRAVVVPTPMPWQRRVTRGIDHARVLAEGVAGTLGAPLCRCLSRRLERPQSSRTSAERRRWGGRGMRRRAGGPGPGAAVVLVDDVLTTGATCRGAVRQLRGLRPSRIIVAVVAVSDAPGRRDRRWPGRDEGPFLPRLPAPSR